jgi:hypothetical protein
VKRFAVVGALVLAACGGGSLPTASEGDATRAQARWPGITTSELNHGRSLYVGHCGSCHLPVPPTRFTPDEWPAHVGEMQVRAGLTAVEAEAVQRYLMTMAVATK